MGVFGKIADAKYSEGGNYMKPGAFKLKVDVVKHIKTRTNKEAFVAEFEVLETNDVNAHKVGEKVTWMVTLDKEPALGNIKQFAMCVLGVTEDQITEQVIETMVNESTTNGAPVNPCGGMLVRASAVTIKTKANRDFTKVKFYADDAAGGAEAAKDAAAGAAAAAATAAA